MGKTKALLTSLILTSALFFMAGKASASGGVVELRSTTEANMRCFATSVLMDNRKFEILVTCRGLIYPPGENLLSYVAWAIPVDGGSPERLGDLEFGKERFDTRNAFSELFVTAEDRERPRSPSDRVVMRGEVEPIQFLETVQLPVFEEEAVEEEEEIVEPAAPSRARRILVVGLISLFALAVLGALVFAIIRFR